MTKHIFARCTSTSTEWGGWHRQNPSRAMLYCQKKRNNQTNEHEQRARPTSTKARTSPKDNPQDSRRTRQCKTRRSKDPPDGLDPTDYSGMISRDGFHRESRLLLAAFAVILIIIVIVIVIIVVVVVIIAGRKERREGRATQPDERDAGGKVGVLGCGSLSTSSDGSVLSLGDFHRGGASARIAGCNIILCVIKKYFSTYCNKILNGVMDVIMC